LASYVTGNPPVGVGFIALPNNT